MPYTRKTRDEWHLLANYGYGHGWEHELTEDSRKEAKERLKEYRKNAGQYSYKLRKVRVRIEEPATITPVPSGSRIYNAADKPGFERGDMGKGKPKSARIYSVTAIDASGQATCESWNAWGEPFVEVLPLLTLEPYKKD